MPNIRPYSPSDYPRIVELYTQSDLYGGQFDEDRDSAERLNTQIQKDPEAIWVCESESKIIGTVSLIEDGRTAWLFRFAVASGNKDAIELLYKKAAEVLKKRGHKQILVYAPSQAADLNDRYHSLGFHKGGDYTCYWREI